MSRIICVKSAGTNANCARCDLLSEKYIMKTNKILLSLTLAATSLVGTTSVAHADLLTYFNFEDNTPSAAGVPAVANLQSDPPGLQQSTITTNFDAANVTSFAGTITNVAPNNVQVNNQSLALVGGGATGAIANNGRFIQFGFNTLNFENPILTFATQRTSSGFNNNQFSYSTDGTTFTNFGSAFTPIISTSPGFGNATTAVAASIQTFDLSSVDAVDNQANVIFRLIFDGATTTTGNNRIDNLQVNATQVGVAAVPEPSTYALFAIGMIGMVVAMRRKKAAEDATAKAAESGSALLPC